MTATGPTDGQAGRDRAEASDASSATPSNEAWLSDYLGRAAEFWQRAGRAGASLGQRWGDRSLQDGEWTADTVTADAIEAWEELTPLTGEGLELWIELVQRSLRSGRPDG